MTGSDNFPGEFQAGDLVGDTYVVVDYIGRGAMGHVYQVSHNILTTEYALKTLSTDKITEIAWRRFQNEAHAIAILNHPNIVSLYNLGLHKNNIPWYVMDLLRGQDLSEKLKHDGPLDVIQAVQIFIEVCSGISYAHKKGIVHRDIKPGNIFLLANRGASGEHIKVVDFGIAKLAETKDPKNQALTSMGDVVGTPYYMSPEQCMGQRVDSRSDIYSLGCTLFEALTGNLPFRARTPTETMMLHTSAPPPTLSKASGGKEFPHELESIIATSLAKEPADRFQTVEQLGKALAGLLEQLSPGAFLPGGMAVATATGEPGEGPTTVQQNATATDSRSKQQKKQKVALVVPLASALAVGALLIGYYFGHNFKQTKQPQQHALTDQLEKFHPKLSNEINDNKASELQFFSQEATQLDGKGMEALLPINQLVTVSLMMKKPFSTIVTENGKKFRSFDFPKDVVIGDLQIKQPPQPMRAEGQLKYPEACEITLLPADVVARYPEALRRFQPGDIYGLRFLPDYYSEPIFKATTILKDVKKIDFLQCKKLSKATPAILHTFQKLNIFNGAESAWDGPMLSEAHCWDHIEELNLYDTTNLSPFLRELRNSKTLTKLNVAHCHLNSADIHNIAGMSSLTDLDIGSTTLTAADLEALTALHRLNYLHLRKAKIDAAAFAVIKQFKALRYLDVAKMPLSHEQLTDLTALHDLKELDAGECGLDDSAIEILENFKSLEKVHLRCKSWKKGTILKLKEGLPGLHVS